MSGPISVIVPVHNEANGLARRANALLDGLPDGSQVVFICNGCTDDSKSILDRVAAGRAFVLETPKGKARAIRSGEAICSVFPRFYVDSDIDIRGEDLLRLADELENGIELVSPRVEYDMARMSLAAGAINRYACKLPHIRQDAFHCVLGVTAKARARWAQFPDVIADDTFIEAHVLPSEKKIAQNVSAQVRPPARLHQWIAVRTRWRRGENQLRRMNIVVHKTTGQTRAIIRSLKSPRLFGPAFLYVGVVAIARILATLPMPHFREWHTDTSSRMVDR